MSKGFSFTTEWRTTEIRSFERDCYDGKTFAEICDGFTRAFKVELEEIGALKEWAAKISEESGIDLEIILADAAREYRGIIDKSNFLNNRRKEIEAQRAKRRGQKPTLLTEKLSDDKDIRILQEPEYMGLLNEDLSDPSHYSTPQARRIALENRKKLDRAEKTVRDAEALSASIRRLRTQ